MTGSAAKLIRIVLFSAALLALSPACRKESASSPSPAPQVTIDGRSWFVDPAMTDRQRIKGLSGRDYLPPDVGMLFIYPRPHVLIFWMEGCLIDLDIAFIDPNMRVVKMYTMSVEPDLKGNKTYSSEVPAQFALEVAAGTLKQAGIRVGDQVVFSRNIPSPAKAQEGP